MAKFAIFNNDGLPTAFYSEDVHGSYMRPVYGPVPMATEEEANPVARIIGEEPNPESMIPTNAIKITDAQWADFLDHQGERRWDGSAVVVHVPPEQPALLAPVSDRQFFQALAIRGHITEDEALDAVGPGIIPAAMLALIEQLPGEAQFGAKMLIRGATIYERGNDLAGLIGSLYGWDDEALDKFWAFTATL